MISERISDDILPPNENFEYGYPHSNASLQFRFELERCKPRKTVRHPTKCDVINDVKQFQTVYRRIYCRKFFDVIQSEEALQKQVHLNGQLPANVISLFDSVVVVVVGAVSEKVMTI